MTFILLCLAPEYFTRHWRLIILNLNINRICIIYRQLKITDFYKLAYSCKLLLTLKPRMDSRYKKKMTSFKIRQKSTYIPGIFLKLELLFLRHPEYKRSKKCEHFERLDNCTLIEHVQNPLLFVILKMLLRLYHKQSHEKNVSIHFKAFELWLC